ncbi:Endosulphine [Penicillium cf. griseofulvum]|uniref:mRNA stability protein n=1 Tax=Penicillium cf. griseofulvum TaxID=2972120 RepID=A0A9W9T101_9EURO|nr:Endosulphine [Penicillium cf. griseofulvum]KAJ5437628.1 Endosulphine [Penicillium cf. griseofulvum]KAJ5441765.1 Endosulphine [Penicillium cf. griseofulvum]
MQSEGPYPENHPKKYGKLPHGGLLAPKSKERTYFDSGDFALSAAHHETDNGAIQTGRAHPHRESISHPFSPIPASSNVGEDANQDTHRKSASTEQSPLLHQTDTKDDPTNKEGQDDQISREC